MAAVSLLGRPFGLGFVLWPMPGWRAFGASALARRDLAAPGRCSARHDVAELPGL